MTNAYFFILKDRKQSRTFEVLFDKPPTKQDIIDYLEQLRLKSSNTILIDKYINMIKKGGVITTPVSFGIASTLINQGEDSICIYIRKLKYIQKGRNNETW